MSIQHEGYTGSEVIASEVFKNFVLAHTALVPEGEGQWPDELRTGNYTVSTSDSLVPVNEVEFREISTGTGKLGGSAFTIKLLFSYNGERSSRDTLYTISYSEDTQWQSLPFWIDFCDSGSDAMDDNEALAIKLITQLTMLDEQGLLVSKV